MIFETKFGRFFKEDIFFGYVHSDILAEWIPHRSFDINGASGVELVICLLKRSNLFLEVDNFYTNYTF